MIKVKKGSGPVFVNNRKLVVDVYRFIDIPGIFIYNKFKQWFIAHESGYDLNTNGFKDKNKAAKAAIVLLKNIDFEKKINDLLKDAKFKRARKKLDAAALL